jgi:hypothetical protein
MPTNESIVRNDGLSATRATYVTGLLLPLVVKAGARVPRGGANARHSQGLTKVARHMPRLALRASSSFWPKPPVDLGTPSGTLVHQQVFARRSADNGPTIMGKVYVAGRQVRARRTVDAHTCSSAG